MIEVPIYNRAGSIRAVALVDDDDANLVLSRRWHLVGKGYVRDSALRGVGMMHRFLIQPPLHRQVDHINGDKLDNRRANLRICTNAQNVWNMTYAPAGSSRFVGVTWKARRNPWHAHIEHLGRHVHLGCFATEIEAALARDAFAREQRGEFGTYNFPQPGERSALREAPDIAA